MGVLGAIRVDGMVDHIIEQGSGTDYQKNLDYMSNFFKHATFGVDSQ